MPSSVTLFVEIEDILPIICRTIEVSGTTTLHELHQFLQDILGWSAQQPYKFYDVYEDYRPVHQRGPEYNAAIDSLLVSVSDLITTNQEPFHYHYGNAWGGWTLKLHVQQVHQYTEHQISSRCVSGQRAAPPEAAHGPDGYAEVLRQWYSGRLESYVQVMLPKHFDPDVFDTTSLDRRLSKPVANTTTHIQPTSYQFQPVPQTPLTPPPTSRRPFGWLRQKTQTLFDAARAGDVDRFVDVLMLELLDGEMDMVDRRRLINAVYAPLETTQVKTASVVHAVQTPAKLPTTSYLVSDSELTLPMKPNDTTLPIAEFVETSIDADKTSSPSDLIQALATETVSPTLAIEDIDLSSDEDADSQEAIDEEITEETTNEDVATMEPVFDVSESNVETSSVVSEDRTALSEHTDRVEDVESPTDEFDGFERPDDLNPLPQIITLKKCISMLEPSQFKHICETTSVDALGRAKQEKALVQKLLRVDHLMDIFEHDLTPPQRALLGVLCGVNGLMHEDGFITYAESSNQPRWFDFEHETSLSALRRFGLVFVGLRGEHIQVVIPGEMLRLLRGVVKSAQ